MPRGVAIIGSGMAKFGNRVNESLMDLLKEASTKAIDDARIGDREIQAVYVSSMLVGELTNQTAVASALADELCLVPAAADRIENGPASGGSAVKNAYLAVASGEYDMALVAGGENMRTAPGD